MKNNIIAISGTHGTGKSTLAYNLAGIMKKRNFSVIVLDELARENPFPINKNANLKSQLWMIFNQIVKELIKTEKYNYIICDRSIADPLIYGKVLNIFSNDLDTFIVSYLKKFYNKIFIPDINYFNYQINDGIRDLDKKFREEIYYNIIKFYEENEIPFKIITNEIQIYNYFYDFK